MACRYLTRCSTMVNLLVTRLVLLVLSLVSFMTHGMENNMTPDEVLARSVGDVTGIPADPDHAPVDWAGMAVDTGQKAIVLNAEAKDREAKEKETHSRIAMAVAEAMRDNVVPEQQMSPGVPLDAPKGEAELEEEAMFEASFDTMPEPRETLQAGMDAVGKAGRKAVFSETEFDEDDLPPGYEVYESPKGGFYAAPKENIEEVVYHDSLDERHKALGYPAPKPEETDGTVVTVKDGQGRTVQDVLVDKLGSDVYDMTIEQAEELSGEVEGKVEVRTAEEALVERSEKSFDFRQHTMDEEHPEGFVSNMTQLPDGTVGKAQANRDGKAYPYMFHVAGKGWEVDRGYGDLVKAGMTREEAEKLVRETPPLDLAEAKKRLNAHLDKDIAKVKKNYPELDGTKQQALAMMLYQGGNGLDVSKWKNTNASLKAAIKTGRDKDWARVARNLLNSKWAAIQTPARALRIASMIAPNTPLKELKETLREFQVARGVTDKVKLAATETEGRQA